MYIIQNFVRNIEMVNEVRYSTEALYERLRWSMRFTRYSTELCMIDGDGQ